jgi:hypothetical protein
MTTSMELAASSKFAVVDQYFLDTLVIFVVKGRISNEIQQN